MMTVGSPLTIHGFSLDIHGCLWMLHGHALVIHGYRPMDWSAHVYPSMNHGYHRESIGIGKICKKIASDLFAYFGSTFMEDMFKFAGPWPSWRDQIMNNVLLKF